jgi:preprotein translocase subunit SecA
MTSPTTRLRRTLDRLLGRPIEHDLEPYCRVLAEVNALEAELASLSDAQLTQCARVLRARVGDGVALHAVVPEACALVRETARRALGQRPFDVQVLAGLALYQGRVAEMATGEGKTLAAVAPVFVHALAGRGVHVLTFNDYLARRDAAWMAPIYQRLGLQVGTVQERMTTAERQRAYRADVTYLTAKEAGFDFLRDALALEPDDCVLRPFHFALIDEADSILIDEARIPLVIAGETDESAPGPERLAALVRGLRAGEDFDTDEYQHNIALTDAGTARAESLLGCGDLQAKQNLALHAQLRNALHAEYLLARDVDYIVRRAKVELVDDFTGRVADRRHWPDGLQAAVEAKEGVRLTAEGAILGSITLQHFLRLYPRLAGMTATAHTAAEEIHEFYGLRVAVVPTCRPMIRADHADLIFTHREAKHAALVEEIRRLHGSGRPVLVGTASISESEALATAIEELGVACEVLNAKNDEVEAQLVARAGALGAVTISTNLAGRGTDIRLGGPDESQRAAVAALGGLCVIGTARHASLRIDQQLRGRAGRQGDPGGSRFYVSLEDDLIQRYGVERLVSVRHLPPRQDAPVESRLIQAEIARAQRIIEDEGFQIRKTLHGYSDIVETQRQAIQRWRGGVLHRTSPFDRLAQLSPDRHAHLRPVVGAARLAEIERRIALVTIDRCWSDYLAEVREMRDDSFLLAFAGRIPLAEFQRAVGRCFLALEERIEDESVRTFESLDISPDGVDWDREGLRGPSATWTYLIGENPFGAGGMLSSAHRPVVGLAAAAFPLLLLLHGLGQLWKGRRDRRARAEAKSRPSTSRPPPT